MLVDAGVVLPELELLRDPARVLALHVEEPRAGGRHEPDEDGRPLRLPHPAGEDKAGDDRIRAQRSL